MVIETIRTYLLEYQLDEPFGFSQWYYAKRNALLVEVTTDTGISAKGVNVIPHAWGTMLNLASALFFLATDYMEPGRLEASIPLLETDRTPNPMRDEMYSTALEIKDGQATVPTAPSLGVEPDLKALQQLCINKTETK